MATDSSAAPTVRGSAEFRTLCSLTESRRQDYLAHRLHRNPTAFEAEMFERAFQSAVLAHNASVASDRHQSSEPF